MNSPSPSPFRMTETWWRGIILGLSGAVLLFTIWCLSNGITTIFMHLYYFPIVLLAYRYRWKGFGLATLLALAYLGLVLVFDASQMEVILGAVYRVLVFVGIAAVIAYLSEQLIIEKKALQESTELREQYISLAPAIILVLDRNGAITFLNRKGSEILECTPDEAAGKSWFDQYLPERDRNRVKRLFSQLVAGQVPPDQAFENPVLTCSGMEKIIRWHNTVLHDESGGISGILGFGEDITGERQVQDSLRKMQQFQENVIANANVWISVLAPDGGTILVWNDAAEAISGYKKDNVVGKNTIWKQLYPDKDYRRNVTGEIRRIIGRDQYLENFETAIRCLDGTVKTIVWNTRALRDDKGVVTGYIAIGRDITRQTEAEAEIRHLASFPRLTPVNILETDLGGRILYINPAMENTLAALGISDPGLFIPADFFEKAGTESPGTPPAPSDRELVISGRTFTLNLSFVPESRSLRVYATDITERKQAEEAIRKSGREWQTTFDAITDVVFLLDREGRIVRHNHAFETFTQKTEPEIAGRYCYEILHGTAYPIEGCPNIKAQTSRKRESIELKIGNRWFVATVDPIIAEDGTITGAVHLIIEITERKHMEEAIRTSEERYRTLAEASPDQIYIINRDDTMKYLNTASLKLFHLSSDQVVGVPRKKLFPPDIADAQGIVLKKVFETGEQVQTEEKIRFGTQELWLDTYSVPLKDKTGNVTAVLGIARDITDRKRVEEALRESEEKYRTLFENMLEGFAYCRMIYDENGSPIDWIYLDVNAAFERLTSLKNIAGRRALEAIPDIRKLTPEIFDMYGRVASTGLPETFEINFKPLNRWLKISVFSPKKEYFVAVFENITERIQAEEVIRSREEQFRVIFHNQQTGLIMVDAMTHTISDANVAALSMIGASREEVIGKICHIFICPAEQGKCPVTDLGQTVDNSERILIRANGERIPILKSVNPVKIGGRPFLIESFVDLTERKQMEKQITESRQLFSDIISFLPDPTFVIDKDGKVLAWNRAIEQLSGVAAGDMIGKGDNEYSLWEYGKRRPILIDLVLHPDQNAGRLDYTDIHVDGHTVTAQADIIPKGRGHTISLLLIASPLVDAQGKITGAIESMRDISRLKETEAELARINLNLEQIIQVRTQSLAESERKYRTLFDKTKDAYLIIENNKFVDCNAATLEMLGYKTKEELFQTHPSSLSPPIQPDGRPSFEKAEEMMAIALRDGSNRFEWVHRRANGEDFWVEVSLTAIPIKDHQIIHTAWRDITDRKKAEAEIRASLEEKIILLREVHHRVKNNLQIIISLVSLQMRQTEDPVVKQIMSETQNRVRAMSLVHEKLYRSDSLSHIDFADYTRFLATQLFSFYGKDTRMVHLEFAMEKILLDINTAVPLGLLMNELISNSLRHAFPGGREGVISISGGYKGDLITLVVRDNGIGIPKDFNWKNTTSLGMGLISSLVDQVDGTITLNRENGTMFTITVKRDPVQKETDDGPIQANRGLSESPAGKSP